MYQFQLGPKVAEALINSFGQELGNIHIVGHSLGSHLAGLIGRTINTKSNGAIKLQRYFFHQKPVRKKTIIFVEYQAWILRSPYIILQFLVINI